MKLSSTANFNIARYDVHWTSLQAMGNSTEKVRCKGEVDVDEPAVFLFCFFDTAICDLFDCRAVARQTGFNHGNPLPGINGVQSCLADHWSPPIDETNQIKA